MELIGPSSTGRPHAGVRTDGGGAATSGSRLLVASDTAPGRHRLRDEIRALGFDEVDAMSLGALLISRTPIRVDAAVVDVEGLEVDRAVGAVARRLDVPVVTVAAPDDRTAAAALDAGAADHLELPFRAGEVAARLRSVLRRDGRRRCERVVTADFELDFASRRACRGGTEVGLAPKEWSLVDLLVRHDGRIVRNDRLLAAVWGPDKVDHAEYVRVCLHTVRRKLEPDPHEPRYFVTVPRVGVRFDALGGGHPPVHDDDPAGAVA